MEEKHKKNYKPRHRTPSRIGTAVRTNPIVSVLLIAAILVMGYYAGVGLNWWGAAPGTVPAANTYSAQVLYPNGTISTFGRVYIYDLNTYGLTDAEIAATPLTKYTLWNTFLSTTAGVAPLVETATATYIYRAVANDTLGQLQPVSFIPSLGENNVTLYLAPTSVAIQGTSDLMDQTVVGTIEADWEYDLRMLDTKAANTSMGYQPYNDYGIALNDPLYEPANVYNCIIITMNQSTNIALNQVDLKIPYVAESIVGATIIFTVNQVFNGEITFALAFGSLVQNNLIKVVSVAYAFGNANGYSVKATDI